MRTIGLWLLLVGCGDDSSRHIVDGPTGCQTTDCAAASGSISGLQWLMPCEMSASEKTCLSTFVSTQATVMGAAGATYQVTLRLRGVVELKSYVGGGGTTTNYWTVGGTAPNDGYNVYELAISEPPQNYFLNSGPSNVQIAYPIDYSETIQVTTGATLTLSADPVDAGEVKNVDANLQPVSIAGTTVAQPYDGQFIEMDVTDIEGS